MTSIRGPYKPENIEKVKELLKERGITFVLIGCYAGKTAMTQAFIESMTSAGNTQSIHYIIPKKEPERPKSEELILKIEDMYRTLDTPAIILKQSPKDIFNKRNRKRHY